MTKTQKLKPGDSRSFQMQCNVIILSNVVRVNRYTSSVIRDNKDKKIVNSKARVERRAIRLFNKEQKEMTSLIFKTICLDRLRRSNSRIWIRGAQMGLENWSVFRDPL